MENLENDINIKCPLCNAKSKFEKIFYKENVFSGSQIFDFYPEKQKNDIDFGLGDCIMDIRQCCNCGFIYNFEFDHNKIEKVYSSKKYMQQKVFSKTLNNTLVYIKNKIKSFSDKDDIFLEIAPGLGDLLLALSQEVKFIYAVDPSPSSKEIIKNCNNIKYIQSFFDEKIKIKIDKKIDFIIFRHLLEHIENPREFLINVVNMLSEQGKIYIEVPNAQEIFDNGRFYEFFHDHVCYFQPNTLINILNELGCELLEIEYLREKQFMGLFFKKNKNLKLNKLKVNYINNSNVLYKNINDINNFASKYNNIAIMGGGIHANSILNYLNENNRKNIIKCFDANTSKIGRFLQNTDIKIVEINEINLKEIELIIMAMPVVESYVFDNEINSFINSGFLPNLKAIVLTRNNLKFIKYNKE